MTDLTPDLATLLLDAATDMISLHAPDGTIRWASAAARQVLGYEPAALVGQRGATLIYRPDLALVDQSMAELLADPVGAAPRRATYRCIRANGSLVWIEGHVRVLRDAEGRPRELVAVSRDVTAQKEQEVARGREAALLEATFMQSVAGINVYRAVRNEAGQVVDLEIEASNPASLRMIPPRPDALNRRRSFSLDFPHTFTNGTFAAMVQVLETGDPWHADRRVQGDGIDGWYLSRSASLADDRIVTSFLDISNLRQAESEAREAQEQLALAAEVAGLGLTERDLTTDVVRISPEFARLYGFPADKHQATPQELTACAHPDDLKQFAERFGGAVAQGQTEFQIQYRIRHIVTGEERLMLTKNRLVRDPAGRPTQMLAVTLDMTDSMRIQAKAAEAQVQLSTAAEVAGLGLSVRELATDHMRVTPMYARLFGLDESQLDLPESVIQQLVHPEDARILAQNYFRALEQGHDAEVRYRIRRAGDGQERTLLTKARLVRDTAGHPIRAIAATLDLTDAIRAEERVQQVQDQFALAAEVAALGLAEQVVGRDELRLSAQYAHLLGLSSEPVELTTAAFTAFLETEDVRQLLLPYHEAVGRGESPPPLRLRGRRADGQPFQLLLKARLIPAAHGQPARVLSAALDLTDTLVAEQRATEAELKLKLTVETAGVGLLVCDLRTMTIDLNDTLHQLLGLAPDARPDLPQLTALVVGEQQALLAPANLTALIHGQTARNLRLRVRRPDTGAERLLAVTVSLLPDPDGAPVQVVATVVDITGAVLAEQRAAEAQTQLGLMTDLAGIGLSIRELPGNRVTITPGYARLYGLDPTIRQVSMGRLMMLTHPDDRRARLELAFHQTAEPRQVQFRIRRADTGEERTLLNSARVVTGTDGQPDRMVLAVIDVTELLQAQHQADEVRTQLLLATEVAGLGLSVRDLATGRIEMTPAFARLYGFDPARLITSREELFVLSHPDDVRAARQGMDRVLVKPEAHSQVQYRIRRADTGEERTLVASARTVGGTTGQPLRVVAATLDITEVLQARGAAEQLQFWQRLTDGLPEILWVADPTGRTTQINQRWYEYTGQIPDDIEQNIWQRAIHPLDLATSNNQHYRAAFAAGDPYELRFRLRRHDGMWRWHVARAVPVRNAAGQIDMWVGLTMDIHEREEALVALRHANQDLDTFIYAAAHDLKSPIDNLEGIVLALREESSEMVVRAPQFAMRPIHELLTHAERAVARFRATLADLAQVVDLQRTGTDALLTMDLATYVTDLVLDMEAEFAAANGCLCLDLRVATIKLPPRHLRSLLFNLLTNALKYRHPTRSAQLWLRTRVAGPHWVELALSDNGIGLDPARATRAFELFGRLHPGQAGGSGIGLFIVRRIVEQAGGQIRVSGKVGEGTTFFIRLPQW